MWIPWKHTFYFRHNKAQHIYSVFLYILIFLNIFSNENIQQIGDHHEEVRRGGVLLISDALLLVLLSLF